MCLLIVNVFFFFNIAFLSVCAKLTGWYCPLLSGFDQKPFISCEGYLFKEHNIWLHYNLGHEVADFGQSPTRCFFLKQIFDTMVKITHITPTSHVP